MKFFFIVKLKIERINIFAIFDINFICPILMLVIEITQKIMYKQINEMEI